MSGKRWSDRKIRKLKTLVEGGLTAAEIADQMKLASRNCVIGKVNRLGLKLKHPPYGQPHVDSEKDAALTRAWLAYVPVVDIARLHQISVVAVYSKARRLNLPLRGRLVIPIPRKAAEKPAMLATSQTPAAIYLAVPASAMPVLEATEGRCRFPLWPDDVSLPLERKFYCGHPSGQSSYCPHHASRCYGIGSRGERRAHLVAA